ncbi:MAG: T9SS type A sorting domain-containing protein [Bacteroidetes bacterium]|nr:T9SS type A sorting domain-containing protein [Bacteroidota bacterium]
MIKKKISYLKILVTGVMMLIFSSMAFAQGSVTVTIPTVTGEQNVQQTLDVLVGPITTTNNVKTWSFDLSYDPALISIDEILYTGTLSEAGYPSSNINYAPGIARLGWVNTSPMNAPAGGTLVKIKVTPKGAGDAILGYAAPGFAFNSGATVTPNAIPGKVVTGAVFVGIVPPTGPLYVNDIVEFTINTGAIPAASNVKQYEFNFMYDATVFEFMSAEKINTLSDLTNAFVTSGGSAGNKLIGWISTTPLTEGSAGTLLKIKGKILKKVLLSDFNITNFKYGATGVPSTGPVPKASITVGNRAPIFDSINDLIDQPEGTLISFTINATDLDSDNLVYSMTDPGTGAMFNPATKTFTWTPNFLQAKANPYQVTFNVTDGTISTEKIVNITVIDVNHAPTISLSKTSPQTVAEGAPITFDVIGTEAIDTDNTLLYSIVSGKPETAQFDVNTGAFSWTPGYTAAPGPYTITFKVTDNKDASATAIMVINVTNVNGPPSWIVAGAKQMSDTIAIEGIPLNYTFKAIDPEGDQVRYSLVGTPPVGSSIGLTSGIFTYTPAVGTAGQKIVQVAADDQVNQAVVSRVTAITVQADKAPVITLSPVTTSYTIAEQSNITFNVVASDPDEVHGDQISLVVTGSLLSKYTAITSKSGVVNWTPALGDAGTYSITFTATDLGGKIDEKTVIVTVTKNSMAPIFTSFLTDVTKNVGETLTFDYNATDANPGDVLTYAIVGEGNGAIINAETGILTWVLSAASTVTYPLTVSVSDGVEPPVLTTANVTIFVPTYSISGVVKYANTGMTTLSGVVAKIGSTEITTTGTGDFSFAGLVEGSYTLSLSKTGSWGGVLSSDALKAALYYVDPVTYALSDIQQLAADVNNDGVVLMSDAQMILNRVVGKISAFSKPDWVFSQNPLTITLNKNETFNFLALATGDVNASLNPSLAKTVNYDVEDVIAVKKNSEFEFPIKIKNASEIGAFTLRLSYSLKKMELISAISSVNVISNAKDGIITLAWADLSTKNSLKVDDNGTLVILKFRATDELQNNDLISVAIESGSEVVDKLGKDISSNLSIPRISNSIPENFELTQNYPNPFNPSTTISYAIPTDGKVNVIVYNAIGQIVATLVNQVQEAGSYKYEWNAGQLSSGIYFYKISVEGAKNFVQTKKMLLLK